MPKLRDILTVQESEEIENLKDEMDFADSKEEVDEFYNQIVDILNGAKLRYFGKLRKPFE